MMEKDLFKEEFKYYKRKHPLPSYTRAVDFERKTDGVTKKEEKTYISMLSNSCTVCENLGLYDHSSWEIHSLIPFKGFSHIKNPFTVSGQQMWIRKCLEVYPRKPSITNLDVHYSNVDDIWSLRNSENPTEKNYLHKLCWATLGYHHNWETKIYDPHQKSDFPDCLEQLASHIACCLKFENYKPEAAIVNYYNMKSSLGIHNDHSEENMDAPIISFSFGQTGIFLIGTQNRTDKPEALFLRSGDIIIMSESCRLAYHAVPCIISENINSRYCQNENNEWRPFQEYIDNARINISVRQVY